MVDYAPKQEEVVANLEPFLTIAKGKSPSPSCSLKSYMDNIPPPLYSKYFPGGSIQRVCIHGYKIEILKRVSSEVSIRHLAQDTLSGKRHC